MRRSTRHTSAPVIATLTPRPARRWVAVGLQGTLGLIVIWLGVILPEGGVILRMLVIAFGGLVLAGTLRLWRATSGQIVLTTEALTDSEYRVLARIDEIRGVDRGAFAFKPSNGFLVRLSSDAPRVWVPGMWWRIGRFVGVGGVTPRNEGKAMAEALALLLAERDAR